MYKTWLEIVHKVTWLDLTPALLHSFYIARIYVAATSAGQGSAFLKEQIVIFCIFLYFCDAESEQNRDNAKAK